MRCCLLLAALLLASPASAAPDLDAVASAPASHIVLLENDTVRVLRVTIAPGATEPVHEHRWPSVMYFEHPQPITYIVYAMKDKRPVEAERVDAPPLPKGEAIWGEAEGPHAVHNRGSEPFVALRVEYKQKVPPSAP